tara:strand:- start:8873 stop:9301 length:429 start_codon:yes stop_codon:yes gene_type:complete
MKKQTDYINKVKKTDLSKFSNKKKVELGLIDNFNYDFDSLQDETGRLSYSVEEWYDEQFEQARAASSDLRDVYLNGSEAFITVSDVQADMDILKELQLSADEIGVDVEDLYDNFHEHMEAIQYVTYLEDKFDEQAREVREWF